MKKYTVYAAIAICTATSITACKDLKPNDGLIEEMKDSIHKIYFMPYKAIRIDEHQDVTITVGSQKYFDGPEEQREKMVTEFAAMTVHFFEDNNYLDEGKVIFVPNETTVPTDKDPSKEYEMDLKSLLKK